MNNKSIILLSCTIFFACYISGTAYGIPDISSDPLSPVVITATRVNANLYNIPQSVTVISSEEIAKSPARNIGELINTVVGINFVSYGGAGAKANMGIRGAINPQVLILIDNQRYNNSLSGGFNIANLPIPIENIERIEILRGGASTLYGSDAMAGVVNIITKAAGNHSSLFKLSGGSFNTMKGYAQIQDKMGNLGYSVSHTSENSDGFRANSQSNKNIYNAALSYDLSDKRSINFAINHLNQSLRVPGSITFPVTNGLQSDNASDITIRYSTSLFSGINTSVTYSQNNSIMRYSDNFSNDTHQLLSNRLELFGDTYINDANMINMGININDDKSDSTSVGKRGYTTSGLFIQDSIDYGQFKGNAGLRYDNNSTFGSQLIPRAGLLYQISQNWQLKGNIGKGYRAPTLNDLYWPASAFTRGNPNLVPETSFDYDYGISYLSDNTSANVVLFNRDVSNIIQWIPDAFFLYSPQNIGSVNIRGVEAEYAYHVNKDMNFQLNYTNTVPVNLTGNTFIPNIDMQKIAAGINFTSFFDSIVAVNAMYQNRYQAVPVSNQIITRDWTTVNAKISKNTGNGKIYLQITNLFNAQYENVPGYPAEPQAIEIGLDTGF